MTTPDRFAPITFFSSSKNTPANSLLKKIEATFVEIIREAQRVRTPIKKITEVFERLVQKEISIRNLLTLLQSIIGLELKRKSPHTPHLYGHPSLHSQTHRTRNLRDPRLLPPRAHRRNYKRNPYP